MNTYYHVDFDTIDCGWFECGYDDEPLHVVIEKVKGELFYAGGGHADIYDEAENFIIDVEV